MIRVSAVGICASDLHWYDRASIGDAGLDHPLILGHEFAGLAMDGPHKGRRVAVDPAIPCGACELCRQGHPNLCPGVVFSGHGITDGALRQELPWPSDYLYPLPDGLTDADGAMLEPLGVAIHAVDLAGLKPGMQVGVFGCGPIGLLVLQMARLAGATRIIATDKMAHRLEAADSLGASQVFDVSANPDLDRIEAAAGEYGLDVAFEAAGENDAVETAIQAVRPGGKVILIGIPDDDRTGFTASTARRKGLTMKLVRRMKHTYPRTIELVAGGFIDVASLVTHRFPLNRFDQAFDIAVKRKGIKVIIEP